MNTTVQLTATLSTTMHSVTDRQVTVIKVCALWMIFV